MREILGYAPVEPDGSVQIKLPAGIPFAVGMLDADGRRLSARHLNWMQLRAGEVLSCNGCHIPAVRSRAASGDFARAATTLRRRQFGRSDDRPAVRTRTPPSSRTRARRWRRRARAYPARPTARRSCPRSTCCTRMSGPTRSHRARAGRAVLVPLRFISHARADFRGLPDGLELAVPHHHPLSQSHPSALVRAAPGLRQSWAISSRTTPASCHSPVDAMGAARVPARQLDLSGGASPDDADHLVSYRELLFPDNAQAVNMGALQDIRDRCRSAHR